MEVIVFHKFVAMELHRMYARRAISNTSLRILVERLGAPGGHKGLWNEIQVEQLCPCTAQLLKDRLRRSKGQHCENRKILQKSDFPLDLTNRSRGVGVSCFAEHQETIATSRGPCF